MRKIIASMLLASAFTAHAQLPGSVGDNPLRVLEEMQACMSKLDQGYLDRLGKQAEATDREIQRLCKAGKRNEAQAKAQKEAQKMMADPEYQKFLQCSSGFAALDELDEEDEDIHVCDDQSLQEQWSTSQNTELFR